MEDQAQQLPGTVLWISSFYNRSGYGVGARATALALVRAGVRVKVFSSKEFEPGIDDCDLDLIRSLENTPLTPPVTVIISHVPNKLWLNLTVPEPNLRIIATTFDGSDQGNLPPAEWIDVCNGLDQLWLMSEKEREAFISAGLPAEKIQIVHWPHPWLGNPLIPQVTPEPAKENEPFRFLSIAMFQPRRRWDTLIEAYLEEFKEDGNVELYLKVNYPSWHPVPGKPRQDLYDLIASLRRRTGSEASIVLDEELGTRMGILHLIDSCNVYVSTDTASTSPISEARVRNRLVIIPEGLHIGEVGICISINPDAKSEITPEMLMYQPHHRGTFMPRLHVRDVRNAMRRAYDMTTDERQVRAAKAAGVSGPTHTVPMTIEAIRAGWRYKEKRERKRKERASDKRIVWEGSQLVCHSLALINRELCLQLIDSGHEVSIIPYEKDELRPDADPRFEGIVQRTRKPLSGKADVHVRHKWPPDFNPPEEGYWVIMQPWEFGSLPKAWIHPMNALVDEMWVPSSYVRECFIKSGIHEDRVFVVPNAVAVGTFNPSAVPLELSTRKRFKFLFVGGTIPRKGIDILLATYMNAFSDKDDVCLVIKDMGGKTFYRNTTARQMIQAYQARPGAAEIEYIDRILSEQVMAGLYTACDCLVHPYRGEGFGLPIAEAMASGLPAIITGYGAALDFCTRDAAYLLPSREIHFPEKQVDGIETVDFPWLVEPDHDSLKKMMRHVYEYPEEARAKGKAARIRIERNFTWEKAAEVVRERLEALSARPIRRFEEHAPIIENEGHSASLAGDDFNHPEALIRHARKETDTVGKNLSRPTAAKPWDKDVRFEPDALERPPRPADSFDIADILNTQGELLFGKGKRDHARACFEMAIEHSPNHAVAHSNLGVILRDLGELEAALESFHRALELAPEDSDILYNSSKALVDAGELDIAADILRFYLQRNPRHEAVWEEYGSLLHQIGTTEWNPEGVSTEAADVYATMGKELIGAKDYAGAGEALHRALRLNAHHVEAFFQLGRLHRWLDQTEEAVGVFRDALRLDSRRKCTVLALGDALVSRAEFDEAISLYEDYLAHQPDADVQAALEKASNWSLRPYISLFSRGGFCI